HVGREKFQREHRENEDWVFAGGPAAGNQADVITKDSEKSGRGGIITLERPEKRGTENQRSEKDAERQDGIIRLAARGGASGDALRNGRRERQTTDNHSR